MIANSADDVGISDVAIAFQFVDVLADLLPLLVSFDPVCCVDAIVLLIAIEAVLRGYAFGKVGLSEQLRKFYFLRLLHA